MFREYTIGELETIWQTSEPTIRKKVKQNGLEKVSKKVRGKNITAFKISDNDLYRIKEEIQENKKIYAGGVNINENTQENIYESEEIFNKPLEATIVNDLPETVITNIVKTVTKELDNVYRNNYEMLREKDQQIFLLEDSERKKEVGYLQQIAELKAEIIRKDNTIEKQQEEIKNLKAGLEKKSGIFGFLKKN